MSLIKINGDIDGIRETTYEEAKICYDNGKNVYTLSFSGKKECDGFIAIRKSDGMSLFKSTSLSYFVGIDDVMIVTRHDNLIRLYRSLGIQAPVKGFIRPVEVTNKIVFGELPFYIIPNCTAFYHAQFDHNPKTIDDLTVEELLSKTRSIKRYVCTSSDANIGEEAWK
ncbi:hypothetical protein [Holdemania sp. 1001302B_160321_E10]|uniref:hypothetical protein n=1 Tax=Holdemania sp. 1001302B_160321_E10 TaxID=2787120 RepID=UPI00189A2D7C|nr:hypothetical protein [Holdemania sp. 1001302B_160321_E10]